MIAKLFQICNLPVELLETILMKASTKLSMGLWMTTSWPELETYSIIAPVCFSWSQTVINRRWFRRTLMRRLARKHGRTKSFKIILLHFYTVLEIAAVVKVFESIFDRWSGSHNPVCRIVTGWQAFV